MNLLIQSVITVNAKGEVAAAPTDLLILNGHIAQMRPGIEPPDGTPVYNAQGAMVSIGWLDCKANFRDPGFETKEGLVNGLEAALAGGFTGVILMPSTKPVIQTKADIEYLISKSSSHVVSVFPTGALSVNREGKDITEMFDMKQAGAIAFTDDHRSVGDAGLFLRAMQYARNAGSVIMHFPDEKGISGKAQVNEGIPSTMAGMKGMPAFAEELMVNRDISICEYTGGRLHFSTISTAGAVDMIRKARKNGLAITADVAAHHLFFDDTTVLKFDTNLKVKPPFRTAADIEALIQGLADGTIDAICSDHSPEDEESKQVEFDFAAFGISGIETAFAVANTAAGNKLGIGTLIRNFTTLPRQAFNLPLHDIAIGSKADLTIFNPAIEWELTTQNMVSRSKNTPFLGMKLKGKPLAVFNNNQFRVCNEASTVKTVLH